MVPPQSRASTPEDLVEEIVLEARVKAAEYAQAQTEWSESFLRHKMGTPPKGQQSVTDGQARAMADQDVDLTGARTRYEVTLMEGNLRCR